MPGVFALTGVPVGPRFAHRFGLLAAASLFGALLSGRGDGDVPFVAFVPFRFAAAVLLAPEAVGAAAFTLLAFVAVFALVFESVDGVAVALAPVAAVFVFAAFASVGDAVAAVVFAFPAARFVDASITGGAIAAGGGASAGRAGGASAGRPGWPEKKFVFEFGLGRSPPPRAVGCVVLSTVLFVESTAGGPPPRALAGAKKPVPSFRR